MSRQLADDQWQIFTELDLQGESEQIQLAGFLDTLIRSFKDLGGPSASLEALETEVEEEEPEGQGAEEPEAAGGRTPSLHLSRGSISGLDREKIMDYGPLPKGPITPETATMIIEVYRRGGFLSLKSVKKILRDIYKALKALPNIIPVNTPASPGRLHVVGDLHGQVRFFSGRSLWPASLLHHCCGELTLALCAPSCRTCCTSSTMRACRPRTTSSSSTATSLTAARAQWRSS
jgi:hypothetical protein